MKRTIQLLTIGFLLLFVHAGFSTPLDQIVDKPDHITTKDSISISALDLNQFKALQTTDAIILDTRSESDFALGYIPKSIHVGWKGPFKIWIPKVFLDKTQSILVIADLESVSDVSKTLLELGYTHVLGYLNGGIATYQQSNQLDSILEISAASYLALSNQGQIIDVRSQKEFDTEHIDNAMNFPLKDLTNFNLDLPMDIDYYVQCLSGYRSMIALSILKAKNIHNVINIQGGYQSLKKLKEDK
ncbi:hypothetical protein LZQ00_02650 [Sphingobacterium sp. SRCM116780]|uniref:rhodanese-like domain-containing protein n=1 Tax=Sphingobacterium sp. SRCM116780 TaxID=2907623 RepID=UPI001F205E18|nr:rhodanese-like domain-containing protein [Sphingobacterium sp. SRCM116780]UIR56724.1 hypothetical protein LZQ00_02650 [Sphingobacterium sp. SRCM116780]